MKKVGFIRKVRNRHVKRTVSTVSLRTPKPHIPTACGGAFWSRLQKISSHPQLPWSATQSLLHPPMTLAKSNALRHISRQILRRGLAVSAAALRHDTNVWTPTPLIKVSPAAESLFLVTVDVSRSPELAASYTSAGQYLHLRLQDRRARPTVLAISSPPSIAASSGVFEFLVKPIAGSTAELLCGLQKGDVVELSPAVGSGFDMDRISPPEKYQTVLIFATGSGIR